MSRTLALGMGIALLTAAGCSTVHDQNESQTVSPDGTKATETRSQIRDTPSGATVKETETRTREVMTPGAKSDATHSDPGK